MFNLIKNFLIDNPIGRLITKIVDLLFSPVVIVSSITLKIMRKMGVFRLPVGQYILKKIGVFPIIDQYYEPQFIFSDRRFTFDRERVLPGINWNIEIQLELLSNIDYKNELHGIDSLNGNSIEHNGKFYFNNGSFESGDAEFWYSLIRYKKPNVIIEIGSGWSTILAANAIKRNKEEIGKTTKHICIEPYENPWLNNLNVNLERQKVENMGLDYFNKLGAGDMLFIDSSHVIRPNGDVVFEYLQLIPSLKKGVIVHIHDIFSPRNYLYDWIVKKNRFWNEQYILEAFLSFNKEWEIIGALNFLKHNYYDALKEIAPFLKKSWEPGSFYIQRKI